MAPPLVLLHAFPVDSQMFSEVSDGLGELALMTPDLPGFGGSPLPVGGPADLSVAADAVISALDRNGLDRVIVGGVSVGGYIALNLLARYPERVAGLVLADTRAEADSPAAADKRATAIARAQAGDLDSGVEAVRPLVAADVDPDLLDRLGEIASHAAPASVVWMQQAMAARGDSCDVLAGCDVPVLVVVGENDSITPPDAARTMADLAPDAELYTIAGAGHLSPAESPAEFAAVVSDWIARRF